MRTPSLTPSHTDFARFIGLFRDSQESSFLPARTPPFCPSGNCARRPTDVGGGDILALLDCVRVPRVEHVGGCARSEDWNVGLAEDLRDATFAREFLLAAIDEGVDLQVALGKVIRAMGVTEFAAKVQMAGPNVLRAINPRHNPTLATLGRLLKPFGLRLSLAPIKRKPRQTAA